MSPEKPQFDPYDKKYHSIEDIPEEYRSFFVSTADGQGFVTKNARKYEGACEAQAICHNADRNFWKKLIDKDLSGRDVMMTEAQITHAIKNITIDHDRVTCAIDLNGHHVMLAGIIQGAREISDDGKMKIMYKFVMKSGALDGETIPEDQFAEVGSFAESAIINKLQIIAAKKRIDHAE
jgi:hypothetical protein